jgi:nucleoid-associated protein YgaU
MVEDPKKGRCLGFSPWYVVKKGDTLSMIAREFYGDASLCPKIFEANRHILADPNLNKVGQTLRIP